MPWAYSLSDSKNRPIDIAIARITLTVDSKFIEQRFFRCLCSLFGKIIFEHEFQYIIVREHLNEEIRKWKKAIFVFKKKYKIQNWHKLSPNQQRNVFFIKNTYFYIYNLRHDGGMQISISALMMTMNTDECLISEHFKKMIWINFYLNLTF